MRIVVLNGPNLNLLGTREPQIYGTRTLADIEKLCLTWAAEHDCEIEFSQSNHEGVLIDAIHAARGVADAILINPAGLTFTSVALMDALRAFEGVKFEIHLANIHQREEIYHNSLISKTAHGVLAGFGMFGYRMALDAVHAQLGSAAAEKEL